MDNKDEAGEGSREGGGRREEGSDGWMDGMDAIV